MAGAASSTRRASRSITVLVYYCFQFQSSRGEAKLRSTAATPQKRPASRAEEAPMGHGPWVLFGSSGLGGRSAGSGGLRSPGSRSLSPRVRPRTAWGRGWTRARSRGGGDGDGPAADWRWRVHVIRRGFTLPGHCLTAEWRLLAGWRGRTNGRWRQKKADAKRKVCPLLLSLSFTY